MEYRYRYNGSDYVVQFEQHAGNQYTATIGDHTYVVTMQRSESGLVTVMLNDERAHAYVAACDSCKPAAQLRYVALIDRGASVFELERVREAATQRRKGSAGGSLMAQMPGQVRQVLVAEGDSVEAGQPLLILEAMKMEIRVTAPIAGVVRQLMVRQGETVERGQQLAEVMPLEE